MDRPLITLKLATSLDGKIALANGASKWVTGEAARAHGRALRAEHDAIAIGANTAELDNPRLTTRISGKSDPVRIVFDRRLRLKLDSNLCATAKETPLWIFKGKGQDDRAKAIEELGARVHTVPSHAAGLDLKAALSVMTSNGIKRLLIEGGGTLIASFIRSGFYDTLHWYRAPVILGGDGRNGIGDLGQTEMQSVLRLKRIKSDMIGEDMHDLFERVE